MCAVAFLVENRLLSIISRVNLLSVDKYGICALWVDLFTVFCVLITKQAYKTHDISVEFVQRNLRNLKDNLKKCFDKRRQMSKSGAAASALPTCKYFEQMWFLHDKTANRPTDSNITPLPVESTRSDIYEPIPATTTLRPTIASCITASPSTSATTASNLSKRKASDAHLIPPINLHPRRHVKMLLI